MTKDKLTVIYGILNVGLIAVIWIFLFLPGWVQYGMFDKLQLYFSSPGGIFSFIGGLILIPALILNLIYILSEEGDKSGRIAFSLGVAGWSICILGSIMGLLLLNRYKFISPILILIFDGVLICMGIMLYIRIKSD